jgi:hypothetical protein
MVAGTRFDEAGGVDRQVIKSRAGPFGSARGASRYPPGVGFRALNSSST